MNFDRSSNPAFNEKYFEESALGKDVMTLSGTINKTMILMVIMFCTATFTWKMAFEVNTWTLPLMLIGLIGGAIVSFATIFLKELSHILAPIYAIFEGLCLGGISALYEMANGDGLVVNAMGITLGVMLLMLVLYKYEIIRVTEKFKSGMLLCMGGICIGYLFSFIMSLFGVEAFDFVGNWWGIMASLVIAGIASLNFLLDFDCIDDGVSRKAPLYMEWYCAFGLMLTLVWLYLELLKLLSRFSKKN